MSKELQAQKCIEKSSTGAQNCHRSKRCYHKSHKEKKKYVKKYVCDQCSKRYRNKGHLYLHVQNCHIYVNMSQTS